MIPIRRPWTRQPPGILRIDRANPLGRTVTHALPLNGAPYEVVTGAKLTLGSGGSWKASAGGIALVGSGSAAAASIPIDLSSYTKLSVSFWLYWDTFANDDKLAMEYTVNFNSNSGFIVDPNSGAPASGFFNAGIGTGANASRCARPSAGAWHHYVFLFDRMTGTAASTTTYIDGVAQSMTQVASGDVSSDTFANSTLYLFSRANASLFGAGKMTNLVMRGEYLMSAGEVFAEYLNSWQIYEPRSIPIPLSAAASGLPTLTGITLSNLGTTSFTDTIAGA